MGIELALAELPLALFSTLTPMGAGAFLTLAVGLFAGSFDGEVLRRVDRLTVVPLALVIAGFFCALFHLAGPMGAFGAFLSLGTSPLSSEVVMGVVFCAVAFAYWVVVMCEDVGEGLRRGFCAIVAAAGLAFCVFAGLAFGADAVPSWNTAAVPLSMLSFGILGGSAVGMAVFRQAGAYDAASRPQRIGALALTWIGCAGSVVFFALSMGIVSRFAGSMAWGADVAGAMLPWALAAVMAMLLAACGVTFQVRRKRTRLYSWGVVAASFVGILLARLSFYGIGFTAGLGA